MSGYHLRRCATVSGTSFRCICMSSYPLAVLVSLSTSTALDQFIRDPPVQLEETLTDRRAHRAATPCFGERDALPSPPRFCLEVQMSRPQHLIGWSRNREDTLDLSTI